MTWTGGALAVFAFGRRAVARLVELRASRIAGLLKASGGCGSPRKEAATSVGRAIGAAFVLVPASVAAAFWVSPWFLCASALPLAFVLLPEIRLRDRAQDRREGVEGELPYFSVIASILGSVGVPLYSAFRDLAEEGVFPYMKKEGRLVKRDVEIFGMNQNDALERLAAAHPSKKLGVYLLGYTSKVRSGGDLPAYLSFESGELLQELKDSWDRYVSRVGTVGTLMVMVFGVVPLLLMVVGTFSPRFAYIGVISFAGAGVPVLTVALLYLAARMQPVREEKVRGKAGFGLLLSLGAGGAGFCLASPWVGGALALLAFFTWFGFSVRGQLRYAKAVDDGLSLFLRDLMEYTRQEYDLPRAVVSIASTCRYNSQFDSVLSELAKQVRAGVPIEAAAVGCRSRLGKMTFLMLGEMGRSGGGTVDTVFQISKFLDGMASMRKNASEEVKPYLLLSYSVPCLLAFGVAFVEGILSAVGRSYGELTYAVPSAVQLGNSLPSLSQLADLLIVACAASLGLIGAKITDFTARNTLRAAANVLVALVAIGVMGLLGQHLLEPLFAR